ncbi:PREDICTED: uncharacterized protein LOC103337440 [Prunus mume]|uniref:Uncharacterized protein LOC103337440 n=1 Tax=Prunus mume TaxID=102107 RepID=A0ABM0PFB4_PRUMU|nr:PREDICTED: uncharacterized protein LOC103337440 [Prunus mume]
MESSKEDEVEELIEEEEEDGWECPRKPKKEKANYMETKEEMMLMALVESKEAAMQRIWFLNSGCSNHMCGKKEMFGELDSSFKESVKLGNNSSLIVQGKGNVQMEVNGIIHVIIGVFYIPDLQKNLLSIGQLQEKGLTVLIQHGKCKIFHSKRGLIMETKISHNKMFAVLAGYSTKEQKCFSSLTIDQAQLSHYRYGHHNWNGLKVLQQKQMVEGLPQFTASQRVCKIAW